MEKLSSIPSRRLSNREVDGLKYASDNIENSETLFFTENGVIGFFINIADEDGFVVGFDDKTQSWYKLDKFDSSEQTYDSDVDSVMGWFNSRYDDYSIYGISDAEI